MDSPPTVDAWSPTEIALHIESAGVAKVRADRLSVLTLSVLAGAFMEWLDNVSKHTKIYFGTYQTDEYKLYQQTPLKKFMFPFLEGIDYPKASDGIHHGPEFNRDLAKILKDFLQTD